MKKGNKRKQTDGSLFVTVVVLLHERRLAEMKTRFHRFCNIIIVVMIVRFPKEKLPGLPCFHEV